ncbi:MAG: SycD/LcrH family type III secretion system chaperone [Waddliaceae bacterium]
MKKEQRQNVKKAAEQLGRGVQLKDGKRFDKASTEALFNKLAPRNIVGLTDFQVEGMYGQAYRLYNNGKYKDAMEMFRLLTMVDANEPKYFMGMAASLHMMKQYKGAVSVYMLCGTLDPLNPVPHYHAADCYIKMKDPFSAIISLEMAVKRAGDKPEFQAIKERSEAMIKAQKKQLNKQPTTDKREEKKKRKKPKK